ncbi:MAG: hypothetical protein WCH34_04625 [Bacteroidota bacterium]
MKTLQKTMLLKSSLLIVLLTFSLLAMAQKTEKRKEIKEKIESQKVAFITEKLSLTPDESKVFWPVYNEYQTKKETLTKEFLDANKALRQKGIDKMTDEEATAFVDNQLIHAQKTLDLKKEYVGKFKKVIPIKKVATLQKAEREFQKELINKVKNRQRGKGNGRGKGGYNGGGNGDENENE